MTSECSLEAGFVWRWQAALHFGAGHPLLWSFRDIAGGFFAATVGVESWWIYLQCTPTHSHFFLEAILLHHLPGSAFLFALPQNTGTSQTLAGGWLLWGHASTAVCLCVHMCCMHLWNFTVNELVKLKVGDRCSTALGISQCQPRRCSINASKWTQDWLRHLQTRFLLSGFSSPALRHPNTSELIVSHPSACCAIPSAPGALWGFANCHSVTVGGQWNSCGIVFWSYFKAQHLNEQNPMLGYVLEEISCWHLPSQVAEKDDQ